MNDKSDNNLMSGQSIRRKTLAHGTGFFIPARAAGTHQIAQQGGGPCG